MILLVSHTLVLRALGTVLSEAGLEVAATLTEAGGLDAVWQRERPDVVVIDAALESGLDGIAVAAHLVSSQPGARVLILSARVDREALLDATDAKVQGFVRATAPVEVLVQAVRDVAAGKDAYDPQSANDLVRAVRLSRDVAVRLTPREKEVLAAICAGSTSTGELARLLNMGPATVKSHVSSLQGKFEVHDRAALVAAAYRAGLVPDRRSG